MTLKISDDLILPIEAVTQKFAWLGRTGSGKSYGSTKMCELMLEAGAQVLALDPVGVWWGLRTGKRGFPIVVLGGLHGDLPLDADSGALVANLIVDRNLSAVLDVSQMLQGEQQRFATAFITQLFERKKAAPSAMHVFIEECQEFVPQNVGKGETHLVHAFERLIKLGRNFGIGASLISQRPQEVNKKALNQTEVLFAFQMTGPQERKAIEAWVSEKGADDDIVNVLPKLRVGEPHVWSPQWLGVSKTIRIARKRSEDVSSTPKVGEVQGKPAKLSAVDLEELRGQMGEAIERAKEEDPGELRKRIAGLEKELRSKGAAVPALARPVLDDALLTKIQETKLSAYKAVEMINGLTVCLKDYADTISKAANILDRIHWNGRVSISQADMEKNGLPNEGAGATQEATFPQGAKLPLINTRRSSGAVRALSSGAGTTGGTGVATGGMRRMMVALAQCPNGLSAKQLGVRAGLSSGSGTFSTYLGQLRSRGWVGGERGRLVVTGAGLEGLGAYEALPTGQALVAYWVGELGSGSGAARMLQALADAYPKAMTKEELGSKAGISHVSGTFSTYLGKLRTLELVAGSRELRASDELSDVQV